MIEGIQYQSFLYNDLITFDVSSFNINSAPSSCIVRNDMNEFAISKWVSPKRTRSYPYARVYDTIARGQRVTVIPFAKDEGLDGDRDFIQWDTISLMSLLEVYTIFGYYNQASRNPRKVNKITSQKFDNNTVVSKLKEISTYQSSALHWNLKEIRETLSEIIEKQEQAYQKISEQTGVKLKSSLAYKEAKERLQEDVNLFMEFSRNRAKLAQNREVETVHLGEYLQTLTKAKITIENYVGGKYFFTVDEVLIQNDKISLIEAKHTNKMKLPSTADIKDGLLKMILYSNLKSVFANSTELAPQPILKLTSPFILGNIESNTDEQDLIGFIRNNSLNPLKSRLIHLLFDEAKHNNFTVQITGQL